MASCELNPEMLGSLFLKAPTIWEQTVRLKALVIWEAGRILFELYPGIYLTNEKQHGKPQQG
jgi:hypothetical protein